MKELPILGVTFQENCKYSEHVRAKLINPFTPGDFAEKRVLKLVEWFSGHCRKRAETYHKPVYRSYTSRPSDPDAKYQLAKFGHAQKAKFRHSFWV